MKVWPDVAKGVASSQLWWAARRGSNGSRTSVPAVLWWRWLPFPYLSDAILGGMVRAESIKHVENGATEVGYEERV